jgi:hypothetical protein
MVNGMVQVLRELSNVRQDKGQRRRRWFHSTDDDLVVWYEEDGKIHGFQFCYDRNRRERALTWTLDGGFRHNQVDAGDSDFGYPQSPILVADGTFDAHAMTGRFAAISTAVPEDIRLLVLEKFREYRG